MIQDAPPAAEAPAPPVRVVDGLAAAEVMITQGRDAEARTILLELEAAPTSESARDSQVQFLLGLLDMNAQAFESAITRFRRVLVANPTAVRVRLEMGRAYFMMGRYAEAEQQFVYARAGELPPAVRENVDRFLVMIRQRKTFSWGYAFAIAPNSNLNAGPSTDTVFLYGLPFELSPDAREKSGVGVNLDANAEWAPAIGPRTRWRFGARVQRTQYGESAFNDMTVSAYTGPHFTTNRWVASVQAGASRRWFGDSGYAVSYGPSADVTYFAARRLAVGGGLALAHIDYDRNPEQSGSGASAGANFIFTPTPASYVRGTATVAAQDAEVRAYAFDSRQVSLSYVREFAGGLTAGLTPTATAVDYKDRLAAFPAARRDRQYSLQLSLLHRRLDIRGLTPRVAFIYTDNRSNLDLYRYRRNLFQFGLTSAF